MARLCPRCGTPMFVYPMRIRHPRGGFITYYMARCPKCGYTTRVG